MSLSLGELIELMRIPFIEAAGDEQLLPNADAYINKVLLASLSCYIHLVMRIYFFFFDEVMRKLLLMEVVWKCDLSKIVFEHDKKYFNFYIVFC